MKATRYLLAGVLLSVAAGAAMAGGGKHVHRMKQLDVNGDGVITADEMAAKRLERFSKLDADADGYVSAAELEAKAAEHGKRRGKHKGKHAQHFIERQDTDGDGRVSLAEFNAAHDKRFAKIDENGDGVISTEEIEARHAHERHEKD